MTQHPSGGGTVSVDIVGMDDVLAHIPDARKRHNVAKRILHRIALNFEHELKRQFNAAGIQSRTGAAFASLTSKVFDESGNLHAMAGEVPGVSAAGQQKHVLWLDQGTGIWGPKHARIFPKTAPVMAWHGGSMGFGGTLRATGRTRSGGTAQWIVARSTAGMKGRPFFDKAVEAGKPYIDDVLDEAAKQLVALGPAADE